MARETEQRLDGGEGRKPLPLRHCPGCKRLLTLDRFQPYYDPKRPTKRRSRCRTCHSRIHQARRRGYAPLRDIPDEPRPERCPICGRAAPLFADHDHGTGVFRGWLCNRCNTLLGAVDDEAWMTHAREYLTRKTL